MYAAFERYIMQEAGISKEDAQLMYAKATARNAGRKDLLLREGDVCRHKIFVISGLLRCYRTADDGSEYILKFSPELAWITEPESFDNNIPTRYNIDALEDSGLLLWTKDDFNALRSAIPAVTDFSARIISQNIYLNQQRIYTGLSATAEEKYDEFVKAYPGMLARVPLHMVASYLGVTRETLSRVRQRR